MYSPDSPWRLSQNQGYVAPKRKAVDKEATTSLPERRVKPKLAVMETNFQSEAGNAQLRRLRYDNLDSISCHIPEPEEHAEDRAGNQSLIANLRAKMADFDQLKERLVAVYAAMNTFDMPQPQIDECKALASTIPWQMGMSAVVDSFCHVIAGQTERSGNLHSHRASGSDAAVTDKQENIAGKQEEPESLGRKLRESQKEIQELLAALKEEKATTAQLRADEQRQKQDPTRQRMEFENAVNKANAESMREIEALQSKLTSIADENRRLQLIDSETHDRIVPRIAPDRVVAAGSRQEQQRLHNLLSSKDEVIDTLQHQLQEDRKAHKAELAKARQGNSEALAATNAEMSQIKNALLAEKETLAATVRSKNSEVEKMKSDSRDEIRKRDDRIHTLTWQATTVRNNLSRTRSTFRQDCNAWLEEREAFDLAAESKDLAIQILESDSRNEIGRRDAEIAKLTGRLETLRSAYETKKEALEDAKRANKVVERELTKSKGHVADRDTALTVKEIELESMTIAKDEMHGETVRLRHDLALSRNQRARALMEEDFQEERNDREAIAADRQKIQGDMAALQVDLERANSINAELDSKLSAQARVSAQKISELDGILADQQTKCCRHMKTIEADSKRIKVLEEPHDTVERKLNQDLETRKADLLNAQIDIGKKTGELALKNDEIVGLANAHKLTGRELENAQSANSEYRQRCDQLDGRLFELQTELDGANSRFEALSLQAGLLRSELANESATRIASVEKSTAQEHLIGLLGVVFEKVKKGNLPDLGLWVAAQVFRCLSCNPTAAASISDALTNGPGTNHSLLRACWEVLEDTDRPSMKTCEQAIFDAFSSCLAELPEQGRAVRCVRGRQNVTVYIYVQPEQGEVLVAIQRPDQSYTTSQHRIVECGIFTWEWYEWLRLDNGPNEEPMYLRIEEDEDAVLWFNDRFPTRMASPDASKGVS